MQKYLISGIPPSHGGVGYLMENLVKLAAIHDYDIVCPTYINRSLRALVLHPMKAFKELRNRKVSKTKFINKIKNIKNAEVILIHPQTINFKSFIELIENNRKIKIYIMDNSFFCIKSYNVLNGKECIQCLNNLDKCDVSCQSFPRRIEKLENIKYLKLFQDYADGIEFFSQNENQKKLLKLHFGENTQVTMIGMKTAEVFENKIENLNNGYDIVFHGANNIAKGIEYILELAKYLPRYKILIPYNKDEINYNLQFSENITFQQMTWNSGLKESVINAKLVINPSIWSAPVEGALLKSIHYNGNVAVVKTEYGFVNDIPDNCLLKLTRNTQESSILIENFFNEKKDLSIKSREWLSDFLKSKCSLKKLFL